MSTGSPWDSQPYGGQGQGQGQQQPFGPPPPQQFPQQQVPQQPYPQQQFPQQQQFPPQYQQQYQPYQQQPNPGWPAPPQPRQADPGRGMRVAALILLVLAVIMTVGNDAAGVGLTFLSGDVATLIMVAALGIAGGAMLDRRARDWSAGLAVGAALPQAAIYIQDFRGGQQFWYTFWAAGALATTALGCLFAFIALQRERVATTPAPGIATRTPAPVLALGIPAVLTCGLSFLLVDFTYTYTDSSDRFPCCSWSQQLGQEKASSVFMILALGAVVLYAALATSLALTKGLLAGAFAFAASQAVGMVITAIAPGGTITHPQGQSDTHIVLGIGFWMGLVSAALFAVAFLAARRPATAVAPPPQYWPQQ
ncbi:MAG TPA: hypothetical protein VL551_07085 [Actinospica sp.]|jgi:hypothetical protein|nr:hypothetical protein [Actinospica sp.]